MDKNLEKFEKNLKEIKNGNATPPESNEDNFIDLSEYEDEVVDETPEEKQVKEKKKVNDYSQVIEEMPELKNDLDYILITKKVNDGKKLTDKEQEFKEQYELAIQKQKEVEENYNEKLLEEQKALTEDQKQQIEQEYKQYKEKYPDKVVTVDAAKEVTLDGGANFLKVAMAWAKLIKSKKKGGKIFVKVTRGKKFALEYTTQDIRFVEFWYKNERGEMVKEITRVNQYNYTFNGTSIPVIFAIQGFAESYDFFGDFKKDLSSEFVTGLALDAYNAGLKDGLVLKDANAKKNPFASLEPWMPLIIIAGFLVMGYIMYTMYGEFTQLVELTQQLTKDLAALKASSGTLVVQ